MKIRNRKIIIILLFTIFKFNVSYSQQINNNDTTVYLYQEVEIKPFFNKESKESFNEELKKYFEINKRYFGQDEIQIRIYLSFIIEKTGQISNISIIKGYDANDGFYENEAIRLINSIENWESGEVKKEKVRTQIITYIEWN